MRFILRFSTSNDLISWTIRKRTDFIISHVEFQELSSERTLGSRWPKGVQWRSPLENKDQRSVVLATADGIDEAASWVEKNRIGFPYDLKGIFGIAGGIQDWHNKTERFCSETITEGFEQIGNFLLNSWAKQWQVTPRDVFISPMVKILEGPKELARR